MTGGACGHVGFRETFLVIARSDRSPWRAAERWGFEMAEMHRQRRDHRRAQHMRDVAHDWVRPSALDEGPQLRFDVFGLLSRKPPPPEITEIALALQSMASLAIFELGLEASLGGRKSLLREIG